jgi:GH18 family chitinase
MKYIRSKELSGVMFWELSNDTDNGELIRTLYRYR